MAKILNLRSTESNLVRVQGKAGRLKSSQNFPHVPYMFSGGRRVHYKIVEKIKHVPASKIGKQLVDNPT